MLKRDLYRLENIEKVITYTPTLFIILLSSIIIFISFAFIHSKEKKEIESIKDKAVLRYQFFEKEKLYKFVGEIRKDVNKEILGAKNRLQKILFESIGYIKRVDEEGKDLNYIISYLDSLEQIYGVAFVLFDKKDLKIYKGRYLISYIRELVFGKKDKKIHDRLLLKYIYSQGSDNFQYWIDDVKKSVRVSYFDKVKIGDKFLNIGLFSNINSLRYITKDVIVKRLKKRGDDYIWLYDIAEKDVYNFFGKKMFYKPEDLLKFANSEIKYSILRYYINHENENRSFKNRVFLMDKFKFVLAIEYDKRNSFKDKIKDINKIKDYYQSMFYKIVVAVLFISLLLIISSVLFSKFVKRVFARYNRRLYLRKESLQHWKKRFELAIIASNDGMWDIDFEKNSIYFSKKWLEISGYDRRDIKTFSDWFNLIHDDDKKLVQTQFDEIMAGKREHLICEYRIKTKSGKYKWILARGKIFKNEKNEYKRMLMMSMDIDKSKQISEELKSIKDNLKKQVQEEIEKNRQKDAFIVQQNKLASMGGMLGSIAHQWRQPLNNVNLILHFIKDNCGNKNFSKDILIEYIKRAKTQIEYMSQTIDDFRNFYKPSKSKNHFDLEESLKSTIKIIYNQLEDNNIAIDLFVKDKIELFSYENELKQSILNILNNAKDAIISRREREKFDAKVSIVAKKVEGKKVKEDIKSFEKIKSVAIISIENNGGKIEEEIMGRIFEPYFTTKFETQGTGIGLYMTKVIIEKNLKGKIGVKNIDNGAMFEIILPIEE